MQFTVLLRRATLPGCQELLQFADLRLQDLDLALLLFEILAEPS